MGGGSASLSIQQTTAPITVVHLLVCADGDPSSKREVDKLDSGLGQAAVIEVFCMNMDSIHSAT